MAIRDPRPLSYIERAAGVFFCKQNPGQTQASPPPVKRRKFFPKTCLKPGGDGAETAQNFSGFSRRETGKGAMKKIRESNLKK